MPDEPDDLGEAVARTEDAFGGQLGRPDYEEGLDPDAHDADVIQFRKACRLLREHDGYHTSVIEMSFAAIERTLEFYALAASNDTIDDFREGVERIRQTVHEPNRSDILRTRRVQLVVTTDGDE